jgi:hypothetical protein
MMNIKNLMLSTALIGLALPAMAQEMRCGNHLISGDQIEPLLAEQVVEKCGEPTRKDGYNWYYEEQKKILVFNGNDELETIRDMNQE